MCGTVGGLSVQQVALCYGCRTVRGSECAVVGFVLFVWDSWGSECAAGGFVLCVLDSWEGECAVGGFVLFVWDSWAE